jgi:hypothetical protein
MPADPIKRFAEFVEFCLFLTVAGLLLLLCLAIATLGLVVIAHSSVGPTLAWPMMLVAGGAAVGWYVVGFVRALVRKKRNTNADARGNSAKDGSVDGVTDRTRRDRVLRLFLHGLAFLAGASVVLGLAVVFTTFTSHSDPLAQSIFVAPAVLLLIINNRWAMIERKNRLFRIAGSVGMCVALLLGFVPYHVAL